MEWFGFSKKALHDSSGNDDENNGAGSGAGDDESNSSDEDSVLQGLLEDSNGEEGGTDPHRRIEDGQHGAALVHNAVVEELPAKEKDALDDIFQSRLYRKCRNTPA